MARARTGTVLRHGDHFDIQITLPDGSRSNRACLAAGLTRTQARAEALRLTRKAAGEGWTKPIERSATDKRDGVTFDVYAEKWLATRRDPKDANAHLRFHILPILMNHITTEIVRADVERVVARLDERVRGAEISWKTAANVWGTLSKLLEDATHSKRLELRVLEQNPADGVRGPDDGDERQSAYLFPKEADALLACEAVPHSARVLYALALYTGLRRGELAVLRAADVVLEGGYIAVHHARDRVSGGTKSTKGGKARRVPIEPHLLPLLEVLVAGAKGRGKSNCTKEEQLKAAPAVLVAGKSDDATLVDTPENEKTATRAARMRKHLELAGVKRDELHADDENRRPLSFHDLRHTFATWLAIGGLGELQIQSRLGHATTEMTQRYITEAEAVGRGNIGTPFGPLPSSLIGTPTNRTPIATKSRNELESGAGHGSRNQHSQLAAVHT